MAKQSVSKALKRLHSLEGKEVSLVPDGANKRRYLIYKNAEGKVGSKANAQAVQELIAKGQNPAVMKSVEDLMKTHCAKAADDGEATDVDPEDTTTLDPQSQAAVKAVARILTPFKGKIPPDLLHKVLDAAGFDVSGEGDEDEEEREEDEEGSGANDVGDGSQEDDDDEEEEDVEKAGDGEDDEDDDEDEEDVKKLGSRPYPDEEVVNKGGAGSGRYPSGSGEGHEHQETDKPAEKPEATKPASSWAAIKGMSKGEHSDAEDDHHAKAAEARSTGNHEKAGFHEQMAQVHRSLWYAQGQKNDLTGPYSKVFSSEGRKNKRADAKDAESRAKAIHTSLKGSIHKSATANNEDGAPVETSEEETVAKSTDGALRLNGLDAKTRGEVEEVFKSNNELKTQVKELVEKSASLEKLLTEQRTATRTKEIVAKAATFRNVPLPVTDIVEQLQMADAVSPAAYEKVCKSFEVLENASRSSRTFGEIGSSLSAPGNGGVSDNAMAKLEAMAEGLVQKSTTGLTPEQAFDEVVRTPQGKKLYAEHQSGRKDGI